MSTKPGVTTRSVASITRVRRADDVGRDVDDVIVDDRNIGDSRRRAGAVDHRATANQHVEGTHQLRPP